MNLNGTMDFIYKNCADRIALRIKEKKLSHRSIYRADPKIIGRICRCEITKNRNSYLIQDAVRDELKEKLGFDSYQDMLWGTVEDINNQLPVLFLTLLTDLVNDFNPYKDTVNHTLCAYIPYARYLGYYKIIFESKPLLPGFNNAYLYNIDADEMIASVDAMFSNAVNYLYKKCKNQFKEAYLSFINTHDSFKRWIYRFEEWIDSDFIPILLKYVPTENSFGIRILKIIETDFAKIPLLNIADIPEEIEAIRKIVSSTESYIQALEEIQLTHPCIDLN